MKNAPLLTLAVMLSLAFVWPLHGQASDEPAADPAATAEPAAPAAAGDEPADEPAPPSRPADEPQPQPDPAPAPQPEPQPESPSEPQAQAAEQAGEEIIFQFAGIPYAEAVRRFCQMADKPLLGDVRIEGNLTFFDERPYTYEEALDTMNLILSMRGFELIETGRYLRIVSLEDLKKMPLQILQGLDDTGEVRPGEIVTVVMPLKHLDVAEVSQTIQPMLSTAGSVASLSRSRGLIITDRLATIQRIRQLLNRLDVESSEQRQMRTFTLMHSSGAVVTNLINRTFGEHTAPRRTVWNERRQRFDEISPHPDDYVTAVFDEPSRTLVLFGPGDRVQMAQELIERFEQESGAGGEVRIYHPKTLAATELSRLILEAVPGVASGRPRGGGTGTEARVIVDEQSNRLIVTAPTDTQLTRIDRFIQQADSGAEAEEIMTRVTDTRVFQLQNNSDPNQLMRIIMDATTTRDARGEQVERLKINVDESSRSLVITGAAADLETAAKIIRDIEGQTQRAPRQMQIINLQFADPQQIAPDVQQLVAERLRDSMRPGDLPPHFLPDSSNRRLIVTATQEQLEHIRQVVSELDHEPAQMRRELKVIDLHARQAEQILPMVQQLFSEQTRGRAADHPQPEFMSDAGRMIVLALPDDITRIETIVAQLDAEPAPARQRKIETVELFNQQAGEFRPMVEELYREQVASVNDGTRPASVLANERANTLLIYGTDEQIEKITGIIRGLDPAGPPPARQTVRVFRLQASDAADLSPLLEQALADDNGRLRVRILADAASNSLVVSGDADLIEEAAHIIEQLDHGPQRQPQQVQTIDLPGGDAEQMAAMLRELLAERMRDIRGRNYELRSRLMPDGNGSRLIVNGPGEEWEQLDQLVRQLDLTSRRPGNTRVFDLRHANAQELADVVSSSLVTMDRRTGQPVERVRVAVNTTANSLVVSGERDDLEAAAMIIEEMDRPRVRSTRDRRIFDVGSAEEVNRILPLARQLYEERFRDERAFGRADAQMIPDAATGRLIVSANQAQMDEIEAILGQLLRDKPAEDRGMRVFELGSAQAVTRLHPIIQQLYAQQTRDRPASEPADAQFVPDAEAGRLIVNGSEEDLRLIAGLVEQIDTGSMNDERQVRIVSLRKASANTMAALVTQMFTQQVNAPASQRLIISAMADDRTLVLEAPQQTLQRVEQLVTSLDEEQSPRDVEVRTYRLQRVAGVDNLVGNLTQLFADIQGPQPRFASEPGTNSLFVAAQSDQFEQIEKLIESFQDSAEMVVQTRTFRLSHADATQVSELLASMLEEETPEPVTRRGRWQAPSTTEPTVRVAAATSLNAVVVQASPDRLALAEQLISNLDIESDEGRRMIQTIRLRKAEAASLAAAVNQAMTQRLTAGQRAAVSITAEPNSNSLLVQGPDDAVAKVVAIVRELDEDSSDTDVEVRIFKIESGDAAELSVTLGDLLDDIFRQQVSRLPGRKAPTFSITADKRLNRLIVATNTAHFALVEQLLSELDVASERPDREVEYVWLENADALNVATQLRRMFDAREAAERPAIEYDRYTNSLTLIGHIDDLTAMRELVTQLDAGASDRTVQLRVISASPMRAEQLAGVLTSLYAQMTTSDVRVVEELPHEARPQDKPRVTLPPSPEPGDETPDAEQDAAQTDEAARSGEQARRPLVAVVVDEATNSLLVSATRQELTRIQSLIDELSFSMMFAEAEFRTYRLTQADPMAVADTLDQLFNPRVVLQERGERGERGGEQRGERGERQPQDQAIVLPPPKINVVPEPRTRSVIVRAEVKDFPLVESLIRELDQVATVISEVRIFKLENTDATEVAGNVRELFQLVAAGAEPPTQRGRQQAQTVRQMLTLQHGEGMASVDSSTMPKISANRQTNSLVVAGTPEAIAAIEQIVTELDQSIGQMNVASVRMYPLEHAPVNSTVTALREVFAPAARGQQRQQGQTPTPITITGNESGRVVIVSALPADHELVSQVIADLDQVQAQEGTSVRVYRLDSADARGVAAALTEAISDGSGVAVGGATRRGQAQAAGDANLRISADASSNALVVRAGEAMHERISQLVTQMDTPSASDRPVHVIRLQRADPENVANVLRRLMTEQQQRGQQRGTQQPIFAVEADRESRSLLVRADEQMLERIRELVAQLEASRPAPGQLRLIPVDHADPADIERAINELFGQAQPQQPQQRGGARTIPGGAAMGSGERVQVNILQRQRALLLQANDEDYESIMELLQVMEDAAKARRPSIRIFEVEHSTNTQIAQALTQMYQAVARGRPQEEQITVTALPRSDAVVVSGPESVMEEVADLIRQLDTPSMAGQVEVYIFPLEHVEPSRILPIVQQLLQEIRQARQGEQITVTADERSRTLVVMARPGLKDQIETIINRLDVPPAFAEAEIALIPLKRAQAAQLAGVLQEMLRPDPQGQITPEARVLQEQVRQLRLRNQNNEPIELDLTKPIKIMSDPLQPGQQGGNRLILSSTGDNLVALRTIVEMMDTVPVAEGVQVRIIRLIHADAQTVAQTLNNIFTEGQRFAQAPVQAAEPETVSGKALVHPLNVAADARSNALVLSGRQESVALAELMINDLDREVDQFVTEVRIFRLEHASASRLAPLLRSVFDEASATDGTTGLRTQVTRLRLKLEEEGEKITDIAQQRAALTIQPDPGLNALVIAARADVMPLIEDILKTMDLPDAGGVQELRIYPLEHADAAQVRDLVNNLYTGPRAELMEAHQRPTVAIDARTNAVVVSADETTRRTIESIIEQIDREVTLEVRDIRILRLENADAGGVASVLQPMLDARVQRRAALADSREAEQLRVLVVPDVRTNSLLVGGSRDSFELVQSLVDQLDKEGLALSGDIRLVALNHANAGTLAQSLTNLFNQRYQAAQTADVQRRRPIIVPDLRTNSLLVAAGVEDSKVLDNLLEQLDRELADPAVSLTVIGLTHNDASTVASSLQQIFNARLQSMTPPGQPQSPQDRVDITADAMTNALIVSASRENLTLIRSLVEKVDVEPVAHEGLVRVFMLEHAPAAHAASLLQSLISQGLYRPGLQTGAAQEARERFAIVVHPGTNSLIISASPENLAVVEQFLKQIDAEDTELVSDVKMYPLRHASAVRLAPTLQQFFASKRAGEAQVVPQDATIPVNIVADARTNTLLVTGGPEAFPVIDRMIRQLDTAEVQATGDYRVFELNHASATQLQGTLQRLFASRPVRDPGQPMQPITVVADAWANALLVGAAPEDMPTVASLIERLDSESTVPGVNVHVLPIIKANAARVAETIQSLYRTEDPAGAGSVLISVDERVNALVVSAGETDIKRIRELVRQLDTAEVARVAEIRVYPLKHAEATDLSTILTDTLTARPQPGTTQSPDRQMLLQFVTRGADGEDMIASALQDGVFIVPDRRTNSLLVAAPMDSMPLLDKLVAALDIASAQMAQIQVFTLKNADARQMADVLTSLFRLQGPAEVDRERSVNYTLTTEDGQGVSAVVGSAEKHALSVTVDLRTNSLLVGGSEHYVQLASRLIDELDRSPAQERKTQIYRLRNAQTTEIETALRNFLDQESQRITQTLGADAVGAAQRMLDREVAIVGEPTSGSLLLSASPRYFDTIATLIEELDQAPPQVLIQVLLAEVTLDSTTDFGVEWNLQSLISGATVEMGTDFALTPSIARGFSVSVTGGDVEFLLRALQSDGRLEVLSRPQILAADNQQAEINIGQAVPLVTSSRITERGDTINSIEYRDVGVILNVTPRISPDGFVRLDVTPEISSLSTSNVDIGSGIRAPIVNQRRATTTVSVRNGHTIMIGGIISTRDDHREDKVPLLGDLPGIGNLFKSTTKLKERSELLIILTPYILRNVSDADRITTEYLERSSALKELQERTNGDEGDIRGDRLRDAVLPRLPSEEELQKLYEEYEKEQQRSSLRGDN